MDESRIHQLASPVKTIALPNHLHKHTGNDIGHTSTLPRNKLHRYRSPQLQLLPSHQTHKCHPIRASTHTGTSTTNILRNLPVDDENDRDEMSPSAGRSVSVPEAASHMATRSVRIP